MAEITWLGDEDPSAQVVDQFGHRFVKGEPVKVDEKSDAFAKLRGNPAFSTKKGKPIEAKEPEPVDPDEGTEIAAVRNALMERGVHFDGRSGLDTLRAKLAAEEAKAQ